MTTPDPSVDTRDQQIRDLEERLRKAEAELQKVKGKLPADYEQIAKDARRRFLQFIVSKVNPGAVERQNGDLSSWGPDLWQEAGELGLISFNVPAPLGQGRDIATWCLTLEELGKLIEDPGFLVVAMINKNWAKLMQVLGRQDLVEKYARRMVKGELLIAWAIWEQADPAFMHSTARKVQGGWLLNADKPIITGGLYAGLYAVGVREDASSEPALFLVERADPNVKVTPLGAMGAHHLGFASLELKDTFLPDDRLLVDNDVLGTTSQVFNDGLLNAMAIHMGWIQRIFTQCVDSLRPKVRQGQPVLDFQHVQAELGRVHMGIELARSVFLRVIEKYRQNEMDQLAEPLTAIFRHFMVERALDTARTVITLQGAAGFMDTHPYGRYLTHVTSLLHIGGAHDLLPAQLGARHLMDLEMRKLRRVGL